MSGMKALLPLATAALVCFAAPARALDEIAAYKAEDVSVADGGMTWRDSAGTHNMATKDPTGITIGDKPDVGSDGKSVVFSGEHSLPFRTETPLPVPTGAVKVKLAFKPASDDVAGEQTLIRMGNWELRYAPEKSEIAFIVWHDGATYSRLPAPAEAGVWQEIAAGFEQGVMTLEVKGVPQKKEAKGPLGGHYPTSAIFVGASTGTRQSGVEFRPLRGALADIHISAE